MEAPLGALRRPRRGPRRAAFTLVETVMSVTILSMFVALAYAAMLLSNRNAMTNRLYTLAEEMARDQIDRIAAATPFNPQYAAPQVPPELALDSTRPGPAQPDGTIPLIQTLPLYADPTTGNVVLNATVYTSVTTTTLPTTRAARVTVSFNFAGRPYSVVMNTLRTSDS